MESSLVADLPQSVSSTVDSRVAPAVSRWPGWAREPLLHFLLIGAVLFTADHYFVSKQDDPHRIVVGAEVDRQARQVFQSSRGREPTALELSALRQVWLDNEVLYREGLALQVDRGDDAIRERVIFKALSIVDASIPRAQPSEAQLRGWFATHRDKYDEPARYSFDEAALAGDNSEIAVRAFVAALNAGEPGDAKAGLRVFKGRPQPSLVQSYGAEFPKSLDQAPLGAWQAQHTRDGWRAIRVETIVPGKNADFNALRGVIQQDYADSMASEQRTAMVRAWTKKYRVVLEAPRP